MPVIEHSVTLAGERHVAPVDDGHTLPDSSRPIFQTGFGGEFLRGLSQFAPAQRRQLRYDCGLYQRWGGISLVPKGIFDTCGAAAGLQAIEFPDLNAIGNYFVWHKDSGPHPARDAFINLLKNEFSSVK